MTPELEWKQTLEAIRKERELEAENNRRWHDENHQRIERDRQQYKHWFWQRGFWLLAGGVALGSLLMIGK